jgi:hypothetical protein
MASYGPAIKRIRYLINGDEYQGTPNTISGNRQCVSSYSKVIGRMQDDGTWKVVDTQSSPTTNRHIRSLYQALDQLNLTYQTVDYWQSL